MNRTFRTLFTAAAAAVLIAASAFAAGDDGKPIDLRSMSRTMAYATVYDMQNNPDNYLGRTVRMSGSFTTFTAKPGGERFTACVIKDAAACCSTGMEFSLAEKPAKLPNEDSTINVEGVFAVEKEAGLAFTLLKNARFLP